MSKTTTYNPKAYIRSALRRIWYWSPMRKAAIKEARISKGYLLCAGCAEPVKEERGAYAVDHIQPVMDPVASTLEWYEWLGQLGPESQRLFCPTPSLQILCKECHRAKTNEENHVRKRARISANKSS